MPENKNLWDNFCKSGKVDDYLKYCENLHEGEISNAVTHQGTDNQGNEHG